MMKYFGLILCFLITSQANAVKVVHFMKAGGAVVQRGDIVGYMVVTPSINNPRTSLDINSRIAGGGRDMVTRLVVNSIADAHEMIQSFKLNPTSSIICTGAVETAGSNPLFSTVEQCQYTVPY